MTILSALTILYTPQVMASICVARSPATAIAIVKELRCKGKMTTTFLGITVVSDLYVLLLSTVTMSFAKAACNGGEFGAHTPDFALPIPLPQPPVIAPSLFLALTRILVMRHSRACSSCSCNILFLCASAWGHWQSTCTRVPVPA